MTIYATPFDPTTRLCTGSSVDCGAASLDDAVQLFGEDYVRRSPKMIVYGDYAITDFLLSHGLDPTVKPG